MKTPPTASAPYIADAPSLKISTLSAPYTGIVFEVFSGKKEIARGGRYDDLLKSLGAKKNIPAVGAAINLKNI